ncbi:MAG: polysaccharide biosynthesis protein [Thermoproteota archaeon]
MNINKDLSETSIFKDSNILITGGTGSIGLELTKALLKHKPKKICLFSNDENGLFEARTMFNKYPEVVYKLGDVRDSQSIERVIKDCDFVFHVAALKHVTFCEDNPYEAISTNILGTQNMINNAIKYNVQKFVFISTDKAVNPISTMGATKLLGEKLIISASKSVSKPIFSIVRFGNVLASRGSVVLIFERQVREGGPITVTDPEMTRFVMLPSEAAQLVLSAAELAKPGEIFVFKMKSAKIGDLAEACREFFAKLYHRDPESIKTIKIGSNPGEKLHEELMTASEALNALETEHFYIINPHPGRIQNSTKSSLYNIKYYASNTAPLLSKEEIVSLLSQLYPLSHSTEKSR